MQTFRSAVIVALLALTRAHPDLGPRGGGRDPYGYWPGAPWPEFDAGKHIAPFASEFHPR